MKTSHIIIGHKIKYIPLLDAQKNHIKMYITVKRKIMENGIHIQYVENGIGILCRVGGKCVVFTQLLMHLAEK